MLQKASVFLLGGWALQALAHDIQGVPLPLSAADDPRATHMATVICDGETEFLIVQVRDDSPPGPGPMVNLQVVKGSLAANTTDPVAGDGQPGPGIVVPGGAGAYKMLVNKTGVGGRIFSIVYHCWKGSTNEHTGTDIQVDQINWPGWPNQVPW